MNFLVSMAMKIHHLAASVNVIPATQILDARLNVPIKESAQLKRRVVVSQDLKELCVKYPTAQVNRIISKRLFMKFKPILIKC